jgi:hypothetical protein
VVVMRRGRELERVSGEPVEREVVARPVLPPEVPLYPVVVHNHYAVPEAPVVGSVGREPVPPWLRLVGYVGGLTGLVIGIVVLWPGPPWAPDKRPERPAQHQSR